MWISIFASQGLRFGSPFSPPLADLEYILRIRALIFHWLRLPAYQYTYPIRRRFTRSTCYWRNVSKDATSRFGSNENIFPVCQSFETFHLVYSKCFQIKFITNKFFFTGRCHFQLSNIRITKRFWLAGDDDYLRGATSINHQVALRANFKMYSRSAKGWEKGDPNRNPWLAKMVNQSLLVATYSCLDPSSLTCSEEPMKMEVDHETNIPGPSVLK